MSIDRATLWNKGTDEQVQVNQRALIDKVLARYSGEFTVFRELLQNSDDAGSKNVEIHFRTQGYVNGERERERKAGIGRNNGSSDTVDKGDSNGLIGNGEGEIPDLRSSLTHDWIFKNDGLTFREEDWNRLKKIAEGNPDEDKIGAFGVGFYSLFSITEEPFVTSGDSWMGFYWKGDQLVARKGQLESSSIDSNPNNEITPSPWSTFTLPLRTPTPIPPPLPFLRFLSTSLTFMSHLSSVSIFLDNFRLARIEKSAGSPRKCDLPEGLKTKTPGGLMDVTGIESIALNIQASVLSAVYLSENAKPNPTETTFSFPGGFSFSSIPTTALSSQVKSSQRAFFSSLFSSFSSSPSIPSSPSPSAMNIQLEKKEPVKKSDPKEVITSTIVLTIYSAYANVTLDKKLAGELVRSTKKNPPKKVIYSLIYTGKDAYDASKQEDEKNPLKTGSLFQGLRADLVGVGTAKIFIGHSTGQTTGLGGHMAARFIPTVERESIDLVDKHVAVWNKELLNVGGYLSRATYTYELTSIQSLWLGSINQSSSSSPSSPLSMDSIDPELKTWLINRALHTMRFFSFRLSTPSNVVSTLLEEAFYGCSINPNTFLIISTKGVQEISSIRSFDPTFAPFIHSLPTLPPSIQTGLSVPGMLASLRQRNLLKPIVLADVFNEMRSRPFNQDEMIACLKWWFTLDTSGYQNLHGELRRQFLDAAVVSIHNPNLELNPEGKERGEERIIPLSFIKTFITPQSAGSMIPIDGSLPLPPDTLPYSISRSLPHTFPQLLPQFFSWTPLDPSGWLKNYLSTSYASGPSVDEATKVLQVLSRSWASLSSEQKVLIKTMLAEARIIPTRNGLMIPSQAYVSSVDIFSDLPVVSIPKSNKTMDQMLEYLGVRKHVDLQLIFTRMYRTGDWSTYDLVKYLTSIRRELTGDEMARLGQTKAFSAESSSPSYGSSAKPQTPVDSKLPQQGAQPTTEQATRYIAADLYEPTDANRVLGLPVLAWNPNVRWRTYTPEATFLFEIGLQKHPKLRDLLTMASASNQHSDQRPKAWKFLLDNYESIYSKEPFPPYVDELAFVPAMRAGGSTFLGKTSEVYTDAQVVQFGFSTVQGSIPINVCKRFGIAERPKTENIVNLLKAYPPRDIHQANSWFEALSSRISEFSEGQKNTLRNLAFVPRLVRNSKGHEVVMYRPTQCYLSSPSDGSESFHSKLFVFVEFSDKAAHFLRMCGVRESPSTQEIAQILVNDPQEFLTLAGTRENFLSEIRNIAVNWGRIDRNILSQIDKKPCLLGLRRTPSKMTGNTISRKDDLDDLEEDWQYTHELAIPKHIVIVDDPAAYALFAELLLSVPQEDLLEDFYTTRGSPRISELVRQTYNPIGVVRNELQTSELRMRILSRLPLFLHEHGSSRATVEYSWFEKDENFIVQVAQRIQLTKHLRFHHINTSRNLDASAAATRTGRGPITLWVSGEVDMYEVANALLSVILRTHKVNDSLLFSTILSTDLRALRRRGYNVDRILRRQRQQKEALEEAKRAKRAETEQAKVSTGEMQEKQDSVSLTPAGTPPPPYTKEGNKEHRGLLGNLRKLVKHQRSPTSEGSSQLSPPPSPQPEGVKIPRTTTTPSTVLPNRALEQEKQSTADVTSHAGIERNVQQAINACKPTYSNLLHNRQQMTMVKESLNDGYCDISGHNRDLAHVGESNGLPVYLAQDVPEQATFIDRYSPSLYRFGSILTHLSNTYDIPKRSMHFFYDLTGGTIAFNKSGSIFLNLRYYIAWHDEAVRRGDLSEAYISWYFTLAHEIAHNLVQLHNAEHEFYFSSICEKHLLKLSELLTLTGMT